MCMKVKNITKDLEPTFNNIISEEIHETQVD